MHPKTRGLAFLLSLGSLPIGCTTSDGDDETGGDTTSPGTAPTTGGTTGPTTTTPDTTTGASDDTETGADTTGSTTAPTTGETTGPGDTEDPPATDPTCLAHAAKLVECNPRYARYQQQYAQQCEFYKQYGFRNDGQMCLDALEALYVCLSKADCAERGACAAENMAVGAGACPSLGG